jgi:hypothetical protein
MLGNNVFDACALTVNMSFGNYLTTAIDTSTPEESRVAGTLANRGYEKCNNRLTAKPKERKANVTIKNFLLYHPPSTSFYFTNCENMLYSFLF